MGCWNGTCGLTQLPIIAGQKCKLIVLVDNPFKHQSLGGGFCYPTDLRSLYSLPITGKYDDYGSIEDIEKNWYTNLFVEQFNEELRQGIIKIQDKCSDLAKTDPPLDIEQIIFAIERGCVTRIDWYTKKECFVTFMLMLDDMYRLAIKLIKNVDKKLEKEYPKLCYRTHLEDVIQKFRRHLDDYKNGRLDEKQIRETIGEITIELYFTCQESCRSEIGTSRIVQYAFNNGWEVFEEAVNQAVEFKWLIQFMHLTRRPFIEGCGAGSQSTEFALFGKFYLAAAKYAEKMETKFGWDKV